MSHMTDDFYLTITRNDVETAFGKAETGESQEQREHRIVEHLRAVARERLPDVKEDRRLARACAFMFVVTGCASILLGWQNLKLRKSLDTVREQRVELQLEASELYHRLTREHQRQEEEHEQIEREARRKAEEVIIPQRKPAPAGRGDNPPPVGPSSGPG